MVQKRAAFDAANTTFHDALRNNNPDSLFIYVADDVWLMPPGEPVVRGKNAMREWYSGFLSQYRTSSLTFSNREVFVGDDWAVEVGTFDWGLAPVAGGDAIVDHGNYMQVWKALPDGQWRFAREIWNSAAPPAAAPAKTP
jgi:ketosteroid isomerase-like protein